MATRWVDFTQIRATGSVERVLAHGCVPMRSIGQTEWRGRGALPMHPSSPRRDSWPPSRAPDDAIPTYPVPNAQRL
jgi:hypothetical protein